MKKSVLSMVIMAMILCTFLSGCFMFGMPGNNDTNRRNDSTIAPSPKDWPIRVSPSPDDIKPTPSQDDIKPTPSQDDKTHFNAYYTVLSNALAEHGSGTTISNADGSKSFKGILYAELIDFDNDGVPELLFLYGNTAGPYSAVCVVYGYFDPSAVQLGKYDMYLNHMFVNIIESRTGESFLNYNYEDYAETYDTYFTLQNGFWTEVMNRAYFEDDFYDDEPEWYVNGNSVSQQAYNDALETYLAINRSREISMFDDNLYTVNAVLSFLESMIS